MKKKGSKKKVNSSKKKRKFFSFFTKNKVAPVVLAFVFLALVILLPFFTTGNAVNSTVTGKASDNLIEGPVTGGWLNAVKWLNLPEPLSWKELIVFIITLAIMFAIILDILLLVSLFSGWVCYIIAAGMSIIGSLIGVIRIISTWFITIGATVGIAAGFLEIIVSIVIFIGLIFANPKITEFAERRKASKERAKAIRGSGKVGAAITGLKEIQRRLKSP